MRPMTPNLFKRLKLGCLFLFLLLPGVGSAQSNYAVGETVSFVITAINSTGSNWTNVTIVDTLPANLTYVSCSGVSTCGLVGSTVHWPFPVLVNGSTTSVTFMATINS